MASCIVVFCFISTTTAMWTIYIYHIPTTSRLWTLSSTTRMTWCLFGHTCISTSTTWFTCFLYGSRNTTYSRTQRTFLRDFAWIITRGAVNCAIMTCASFYYITRSSTFRTIHTRLCMYCWKGQKKSWYYYSYSFHSNSLMPTPFIDHYKLK